MGLIPWLVREGDLDIDRHWGDYHVTMEAEAREIQP